MLVKEKITGTKETNWFIEAKEEENLEYLKLGHFILNHIIGIDSRNAATLHAVVDILLPPPPVEAFIRTSEVCLLQYPLNLTICHEIYK